jgi:uncharacterized protein YuzE
MRLTYRPRENTLRLTLDDDRRQAGESRALPGYVDVGEAGRLVGVEVLAGDGIDLSRAFAPWLADPVAGEWVTLEPDAAYIELSAPEEALDREQVRATQATLHAEIDPSQRLVALSIPRRGAGYEISYPSGNQ